MISQRNALKLSAWIASQHPDLFRELTRQVTLLQRSPLGRLGYFGDDSGLDTITVTTDAVDTPDFSSVDLSPATDVSLSDISFNADTAAIGSSTDTALSQAIAAPSAPDASTADSTQSSGSFWSSIGSGVSNVAGSIGKVASALVSPQAVSAVANAAGAFFTLQAKTAQAQAQAQTQQAILQSQLSRVAQGGAPAAISYVRNPVTGALTPVYSTNTGQVAVTPGLLNRLSTPQVAGIGSLSPTLLIGGGIALIIVMSLAAAKR